MALPRYTMALKLNLEILEDLKIELVAQGHELTGATINSLRSEIFTEGGTLVLEGWGSKVVAILNYGVTAERVPYDPSRRSGAKQSQYIQGLAQWARLRFGVSEKQALGIAFAIAHKHTQEGMPTEGSRRFSETGQRTGAVTTVFDENTGRWATKLDEGFDLMIQNILNEQKSEEI